MPSSNIPTLTKTRLRVRTKVALILVAFSGIALAGALLYQPGVPTSSVSGTWTCSETDTVANFQVKGTTNLLSSSGEKKASEDGCLTPGKPDLLLWDATTGQAAVWLLDGATFKEETRAAAAPGAKWKLIGSNDFNADGSKDFIWQNSENGQASLWLMDVQTRKEGKYVGSAPGAKWKLIGSNDFNADQKPDLLWQDSTDGRVSIWLMDGTEFKEGKYVGTSPGASWKLIGSNDFSSDGKPDLLWQNSTDGKAAIWLMDGATFKEGKYVGSAPGVKWKLIGSNDFTSDQKPDLLWQDSTTGQVAVWLMDGAVFKEGKYVKTPSGTSWKLIGSNDFKTDGKPTLLEYYCDSLSSKAYQAHIYYCDSCNAGQCEKLRCNSNADCDDVYLYTFGTCQENICQFKKIEKYYDLTLKRAAGEAEFSLYEGSVQNLKGDENLDDFFAKKDDGFIARYTSADETQRDNFRFDLMKDYMRAYRFENESLVEDEFLRFKLPYGEDGYKSIQIQTPGQEKTVVTVDLAKLPLTVAVAQVVKSDTKLAVAEKGNGEGRVLGVEVTTLPTVVCGKTWPLSEVIIDDSVQFLDSSGGGRSRDDMKQIFKTALQKFGPKMAKNLPKHIEFVSGDEMSKYSAEGYAGAYKKADDLIIIDAENNSINMIIDWIIPHESAHATHIGSLSAIEFGSIILGMEISDPATYAWQKITGDVYSSDYVEELGLDNWPGLTDYFFYAGFIRPYGAINIFEDIATYAETISRAPYKFINYVSDKDSLYYKKLQLLQKIGIISQDQFNIFDSCQCLGTDILMYDDYPIDNDQYVQGEDDVCVDESKLYEVFCDAGIRDTKIIGCDGACADGKCLACNKYDDGDPPFIDYVAKISANQTPHYKGSGMSVTKCLADNKTLDTYDCNSNTFSIPVVKSTVVCPWKCGEGLIEGADKCLECSSDCQGDKIGTTRATTTAGTYEKCEDADSDGCGAWRKYSCSDATCYGDKIGTTKCVSSGTASTYQKCEDPDGDKCGAWKQYSCASGTFCASGQIQCGNFCDPAKDTDGGANYQKYGTLTNTNGTIFKDTCSSGTLTEYSCASGVVKSETYKCPAELQSYCQNGYCGIPCDSTKETDGGLVYGKKGTVYMSGNTSMYRTDKCVDTATLGEYFCNSNGRIEYKTYSCGTSSKCYDGACDFCDSTKETDKGTDYFTAGSVTYGGKTYIDACVNTSTSLAPNFDLMEYTCAGGAVVSKTINCHNYGSSFFCKDGRCYSAEAKAESLTSAPSSNSDSGCYYERNLLCYWDVIEGKYMYCDWALICPLKAN